MFTCWIDAEVMGLGLEVGSAKGLEEWTEPDTEEVGLDAMGRLQQKNMIVVKLIPCRG
jgi:hypothetical protein